MKIYLTALLYLFQQISVYGQAIPDRNIMLDYFQNQQFEEAISYLTPALARDSDNVQILGYLGYANYMDERPESALYYFSKIITLDSNNISALEYLLRIDNGKHAGDDLLYARRLIQLQPGKPAHYREIARIFSRSHAQDSAFRYYSKAYEFAPADPKNAAGFADILIDRKNTVKADSILRAALARDSLDAKCLKLSIRSAYEAKNYLAAIEPGERLIRLEESSSAALTGLLLSYYNLERYNDCIRVCEYMFGKEMDGESVYYYEAKAYARLKNPEKSNELLETCVAKAISKTAEMYYYSMGENYETLKKYRKAIASYDTAYYLFKNPLMPYNCGRISESYLHQEKLAKKYFTLYLRHANPQTPDEKKAFEFVKRKISKKTKTDK